MKDEFDSLYGERSERKRMVVILCDDGILRPARATALPRFIDYAQGHGDVRFVAGEKIALHGLKDP